MMAWKNGRSARISVHLKPIALDGGVDFPGPGVDAAGEGEGVLQPMAAEPGAVVEDLASGVIVVPDLATALSVYFLISGINSRR